MSKPKKESPIVTLKRQKGGQFYTNPASLFG